MIGSVEVAKNVRLNKNWVVISMVFRSDITIDWTVSPRVITVANTSNDVVIQDLYDTLRNHESRIYNSAYDRIVRAAGKDELGAGVQVGVTLTLLNAVLSFAPSSVAISGTITTNNTAGTRLIDSNATFITDEVIPGAHILNVTDQSFSTVLEVISETELRTDVPSTGFDNQWNTSDVYKLVNVSQKTVSGGNIVAIDANGDSMSPILSTASTQVRTAASSSATLQEVTTGSLTAEQDEKLTSVYKKTNVILPMVLK